MEGNSSRFLIGQVLAGLVEYTNTHFYIEEELMNTFTYPDYLNHKTAHDKFRLAMRQLVEQHKSGAADVTVELMDYLKDWLVNHIQKIDVRLADFLRGKVLG